MSKPSLTTALVAAGAVAGLIAWSGASFGQSPEDQEAAMARDLTIAQKPIFQFGLQQRPGPIAVQAWVDNPNLTYAVGQPMRIMVRPLEDAYIAIVDVGSSGRVSVLYPNHFQRDARVRARSTVMIPSDRAEWQIKVAGPPGVDLVQVIASQKPLTLPELNALVRTSDENPLVSLGRSAEDFARDLVAQLKPQPAAGAAVEQSYAVRNLLVRVVNPVAPAPVAQQSGGLPNTAVLALLPPQVPAPFGVTIRTDKPAYRVGETVRIAVSSRNDCRLTLASVGPSGHVFQLFPNASQRDNLIRAGEVIMVPPPNSPLQVIARAPSGVEGLIAVCREDSPGAIASAALGSVSEFVTMGTVQSFGRDLMVTAPDQAAQNKIEQASTSYIVVE